MPATAATILLVDEQPHSRALYEHALSQAGFRVEQAIGLDDARAQLALFVFDVLLCVMHQPCPDTMALVRWLAEHQRHERSVVLTHSKQPELRQQALDAGAWDCADHPISAAQLGSLVAAAINDRAEPNAAHSQPTHRAQPTPSTRPEYVALAQLVGNSLAIRRLRQRILKLARDPSPVLIRGEIGTGKHQAARALHACSARAQQPWIAVECSKLTAYEAEGAFLGMPGSAPTSSTTGWLQAAQGGTLFLENVHALPLNMQMLLVQIWKTQELPACDSKAPEPLDIQLICSTNHDLGFDVMQDWFQQDLLHILKAQELLTTPLRQRREDLAEICTAMLEALSHHPSQSVPRIPAWWLDQLKWMPLYGNLLELKQHIARAFSADGSLNSPMPQNAVKLQHGNAIMPPRASAHFDNSLGAFASASAVASLSPNALETAPTHTSLAEKCELPAQLPEWLDEQERRILLHALQLHGYNRSAAAARLGISLRQMRYRIDRLQIPVGVDEHIDPFDDDT